MTEFQSRFEKFTDSVLDGIDWNNVLCVGGSVLGTIKENCLVYICSASLLSQEELDIAKCHTESSWKDSDIDLFLYGPQGTDISTKAKELYNVITGNLIKNKLKFLCCTSNRVITIITEPPYRNIQIVNHRTKSIVI